MQSYLKLLPILLLFSGCASITPFIQDFNVVSVAQEKQISEQMAKQIQTEMKIVSSPAINQKITSMGNRIVQALPANQPFEYKFYVVEDKTPNAFAIPGARIYVHTGLIDFTDSDDQLAGVVGHEIGHAYERHPAKSISRTFGLDQITQKLFGSPESSNTLKVLTVGFIKNGFLSRYGRDDEKEADDIGTELIRRAGYKPDGLLQFLRKLESLEQPGGRPPAFLSSHPPTPERIARLEQISSPGSIYNAQSQRR